MPGPTSSARLQDENPSLFDLFEELTERVKRHELVDLEAVLAEYPAHAEELRRAWPALVMLAELAGAEGLSAPSFPPDNVSNAGELTGTLGDFRILQEIGRGGMGVVYEAEQISLGRHVALKVLPFAGVLDERQLQRFKNEALAAAHLNHPHIVDVYGVGCERGVHFYTMRLIDGVSVQQLIAELQATLARSASEGPADSAAAPATETPALAALSTDPSRRREYFRNIAQLGIDAAEALHHAHEQGVIHRDIKPSNLMLDNRGKLWVTDFGLAQIETGATLTMTGELIGTLRYMSPEQASGQKLGVDHRTDVYSLGATLYELLTLQPAFKGENRAELLQEILFRDPKPLCKVRPEIPVDLETIIAKAMAKLPSERYATAHELAEDLRRVKADRPILSRRVTAWGRLRRWARRNPVVATLLTMFVVSLIAGTTVSTWMTNKAIAARDDADEARANEKELRITAEQDRDEAERQTGIAEQAQRDLETAVTREHEARDAAEVQRDAARQQSQLALSTLALVIEDMQRSFENIPGGGEVRRRLLKTSIEQLEKVATEYVEQAAVDDHTMVALMDMADVILQFGIEDLDTDLVLADTTNELSVEQRSAVAMAEELYTRALEIGSELTAVSPTDQMQMNLSALYSKIGSLKLNLGETAAAREFFRNSLDISETLVESDPTNAEYQRGLSSSYLHLGDACFWLGDTSAAREFYSRSFEICERLAAVDPTNAQAQRDLSIAFQRLGDVSLQAGNISDARDFYQQSLDIHENLASADPIDIRLQMDLDRSYENLGNVSLQLGQTAEARDFYQQSLDVCEALAAEDPANAEVQRNLSISYEKLGDVSLQLGEFQTALEFYQKMNSLQERLAAEDPDNSQSQRDLSVSYLALGGVYLQLGETESARELYHKNLTIAEQLAAGNSSNFEAQRDLSLSYERLGDLSQHLGDIQASLQFYEQMNAIQERLAADDPENAQAQRDLSISYSKLGDMHLALEDVHTALHFYEKFKTVQERLVAADPTNAQTQFDLSISFDRLAEVNFMIGELVVANDLNRQSLQIRLSLAASDPANAQLQQGIAVSHTSLGQVAARQQDYETALAEYAIVNSIIDQMIANGQNVEWSLQIRDVIAVAISEVDEARTALEDWETFINRPDYESILALRVILLTRARRFDEIPQTAAMLRSLNVDDSPDTPLGDVPGVPTDERPSNLYNAACGYAVCANAIQPAEGESLTAEQQTQRQEYIDLALACLRESIAAGYSNFDHMRQDLDFTVLHGLPEFEELMHVPPPQHTE